VGVRQLSQEGLIADVRAEMRGRRMQVEKLCRVHRLAANSVGLTEGVGALQLALRQHLEALALFQTQLATLVAALRETFEAMPEAQYLLSVRGFGVITAAILLADIGTPAHYRNASQLIKLAGTQPVPNTSGRKSTSRTPMSGKGRPRLRTALYFAVLRLVRLDRSFAQRYEYLQTRAKNPLAKMQALGALMNRLLRVVWALLKNRTYYMPNLQGAA
jgi:transposase